MTDFLQKWKYTCDSCGWRMDCAREKALVYIGKTRNSLYYARTRCPQCASEDLRDAPENADKLYWFLMKKWALERWVWLDDWLDFFWYLSWPLRPVLAFLRDDELRCWTSAAEYDEDNGFGEHRVGLLCEALSLTCCAPFINGDL